MTEFSILQAAAAGMDAQRAALDLAAHNVAAASATSDGAGFARLVPRFALAPDATGDDPEDYEPPDDPEEPGSPDAAADADADAPIRYLGATAERGVEVDAVTEMVSVLAAQRAYEADASVFDLGKRLAERTIDVGRLQ
jgi:flagellar basal-body rod protein FlgC